MGRSDGRDTCGAHPTANLLAADSVGMGPCRHSSRWHRLGGSKRSAQMLRGRCRACRVGASGSAKQFAESRWFAKRVTTLQQVDHARWLQRPACQDRIEFA